MPASRLAMVWLWMNSMLPTSRPRVGWSRTSRLQVAGELARDDDLLLVAARQRGRLGVGRGRPDVERLDPFLGRRRDRGVVAQEPARVRRAVVAGQDEVVGDAEGQDEAEPMAVGGNVGDAGLVDVARDLRR